MKKFLTMVLSTIIMQSAFAQQAFTDRIIRKNSDNTTKSFFDENKYNDAVTFSDISTFGIYGIGNINTEIANNLNGSGKISGFIRPFRGDKSFMTVNFSFNKNATNTDTLLSSTLLFPEIGNNSFLATLSYSKQMFANNKESKGVHLISPFYEFSTKNIKKEKDSINLRFSSINHVLGCKYTFLYNSGEDAVAFSLSTFLAVANIADQDNEDYRKIFENASLPSSIFSLGFKVSFQYNEFQFFADLRNIIGSESNIPVRSLRGFNSNIGFVFNAKMFEK